MIKTVLKKYESNKFVWYRFEELENLKFLNHWITSRHGGFSGDGYSELNLGDHVGDNPETVLKNRSIVYKKFSCGIPFYLPQQVHSADVVSVLSNVDASCKVDAVIVDKPGIPVGILTADCLPIIIANPVSGNASVIHAGRMGVFKNIVANSIKSLSGNPKDMIATVGPGIRECCYKVGMDVFADPYKSFETYLSPNGNLNLPGAVENQLLEAGLIETNILDCAVCTSCNVDDFYSHRKQNGKAGRFLTGVMLNE